MTDNSPTAKIAADDLPTVATTEKRTFDLFPKHALMSADAWRWSAHRDSVWFGRLIDEKDNVARLTRELAEARQHAALQALSDSTQELGGYEAAKPDVEAVMRLADDYANAEGRARGCDINYVHKYRAASGAARTTLRAALEGKHHE